MQTNSALTKASASATDRVAQGLRHLADEADDMMKNMARSSVESTDAAKAQLEAHLRRLRVQLDEVEDTLVHRTRKAARATDQAIHTHPYAAMGLASLAGVLIGALLARR